MTDAHQEKHVVADANDFVFEASSSEWENKFRTLVARHQPSGHFLNCSRESMYHEGGKPL